MAGASQLLADYGPAFGQALLLTWKLTLLSFVAGFALGVVVTVARLLPLRPLRFMLTAYVEVFRNIPSVALLIFIVFALPDLEFVIDYEPSVVLTLVLVCSAFTADYVRSGINTIPGGQIEIATIQHCWHDPHKAAVAVGAFVDIACFMRLVIPLIPVDGTHSPAADIVGIAVGGEFAAIQPFDEVVHDVGVVDAARAPDALQQCQRQRAVIGPGARRQVEGPVATHARDRVLRDRFPALKLNRAPEGVADNDAHDSRFPDIQ